MPPKKFISKKPKTNEDEIESSSDEEITLPKGRGRELKKKTEEVSDESDIDEPKRKKAKLTPKTKQKRKVEEETDDDSDSEQDDKKKKKVKSVNLADTADEDNTVFYDAYLGHGYSFRISKWERNEKFYICIRRYNTKGKQGANLPIDCLSSLKTAIDHAHKSKKHYK